MGSLNKHQSMFLGGNEAIVIENQGQFERLKDFMSVKNLFVKDGSPVRTLNLKVNMPIAFYRDYTESYVDYDILQVVEKKYKLVEFNEVFSDQMNFFGEGPLINQPPEELISNTKEEKQMEEAIETETKEISSEVSLVEVINSLEVESVTPAKIVENITANKEKLIQAVKQYDNIIVTSENYQELTKTRAELNNKRKYLEQQRKRVKDEASKGINEFMDSINDVIKAIKSTVDPLDADIKKFEELEKESKKKEMMEKIIAPNLNKGVAAGYFDQETADQFDFNPSWVNKSSFTAKGNLVKKVQDEINNELNRLIGLYRQKQSDIATIESTVKQLSLAHQLDSELSADTYIELYKSGRSMPEVQEYINQDISRIKETVTKAVEKNAQEMASKAQNVEEVQDIQKTENVQSVEDSKGKSYVTDEKTGEVLGRFNGTQVLVDLATAPKGYEEKNFTYTYTFSGPCTVIMTLNKFLKVLSKLFEGFNYERIGK